MKKFILLITIFLILLSSGCSNTNAGLNENGDNEVKTPVGKKKELNNVAFAEVSAGSEIDPEFSLLLNKFSIDLFKNSVDDNNVVLSPLSLMYALQMLRHSANGKTREELDALLNMNSDDLDSNLMYLLSKGSESDEKIKRLISNSLWLNSKNKVQINENYQKLLNDRYKAIIESLEFNEEGRNKINAWIEDNTGGVFKDFVEEIKPENAFYLFDTIYFQDFWMPYYLEGRDRKSDEDIFTNYDNSKVVVDMFNASKIGNYYRGEYFLAFDDNMDGLIKGNTLFIVPNDGVDVYEVVKSLNEDILNDIFNHSSSNWRFADITSCFPMFKYDDEIVLEDILKNMGINEIFDPMNADLSNGVVANENIYVQSAKQKVEIDVNEKGITAVAVTAVEGGLGAAGEIPQEKITIRADKPFIYIIYDEAFGQNKINPIIYFMGLVNHIDGEKADGTMGSEVDGLKTGNYVLNYTMKVRKEADKNAELTESYYIPSEYKPNYDKSTINKGTVVEVLKIKKNSDGSYWGNITSNAWICLKDSDGTEYCSPR